MKNNFVSKFEVACVTSQCMHQICMSTTNLHDPTMVP